MSLREFPDTTELIYLNPRNILVELQSLKHRSVRMWSRCWKMFWEVVTVICASRPLPRPSVRFSIHSLLLNRKRNNLLLVRRYPNGYSQYFTTQWPIVYYTWFTASTLAVKSVFWHTHVIHVSLNTPPFTDLLTRSSNRYPRLQSVPTLPKLFNYTSLVSVCR